MRVNGEKILFINSWMNFCCLLLASNIARVHFRPGKALIASLVGAVYAVLAWMPYQGLRCFPALTGAAAIMCITAYGNKGIRLTPFFMASGWLLAGISEFAVKHGLNGWMVIGAGSAVPLCVCIAGTRNYAKHTESFLLIIQCRGKMAVLPAMIDSGNLLTEGITGVPVIVAPERMLLSILPAGTASNDLATLPAGWRLIGVCTAAGRKTLMCFHPDSIILRQGRKRWRAEAAIAISDFKENRALVPPALFFLQGEEKNHACV